jgi:prepilin-type N-terminal cleavage/methylation domain-containing protein
VRKTAGFTLIELLVVVTIIGLLVGILAPMVGQAKQAAKRTACASNLRQIGLGLQTYIEQNGDRFPYASYMPSVSPTPLDLSEPAIYIADVLLSSCGDQPKVFKCPNDVPGLFDREAPNGGRSYFQTERSSYEYRWLPPIMGRTILEVVEMIKEHMGQAVSEGTVWIMRDYNNFHPQPAQRRYLYADGHVTDFEGF